MSVVGGIRAMDFGVKERRKKSSINIIDFLRGRVCDETKTKTIYEKMMQEGLCVVSESFGGRLQHFAAVDFLLLYFSSSRKISTINAILLRLIAELFIKLFENK